MTVKETLKKEIKDRIAAFVHQAEAVAKAGNFCDKIEARLKAELQNFIDGLNRDYTAVV
jgi:hypothetical protein